MDTVFDPPPDVAWSTETAQVDWIRDRLAPFDDVLVGSEIPLGFAAYARILHPLRPYPEGVIRWAEVAAWTGRPLEADSEFHSIAFPADNRGGPPPWNAARPRQGTLDPDDVVALIGILRQHTSTPERCWFCLWDGYGWGGSAVAVFRTSEEPASPPRAPVDPIPPQVREGRKVEMAERSYFLYAGPIDDALAFTRHRSQTPNLFWPDDRAWCVASEIDRTSSYLGGSFALVNEVVGFDNIEALRIDPSIPASRIEDWVEALAHSATETLLTEGEVTITTTQGTITAWIEDSGRLGRRRALATKVVPNNGGGRSEGRSMLGRGTDEEQRDIIGFSLAMDIVGLVE
jgi:hypothetical protein